ncbi:MAG: class I SAM-dependent methyltransferase, partial [Saprospiraceae bacterium]|nr:class I SAM-dependent methyltransferase [Saprospiraceae bacterium]
LTQHGLIDLEELEVMINALQKLQKPKVMDLGCGNGNITQHLHKKLPGSDFTGIDISSTGISYANQNFAKPGLAFYQGNMKSPGPGESFDAFIALDTFYYVSDLKTVLSACKKISAPGARLLTYFSQWIMDESYQDYLNPEMTRLARECKELNLSYKTTDLTASGIQHWKLKEKVLKDMKDEFFKEGFMHLWDYRFREATRYANWGDDKYARFFYEIAL